MKLAPILAGTDVVVERHIEEPAASSHLCLRYGDSSSEQLEPSDDAGIASHHSAKAFGHSRHNDLGLAHRG